MVVKYIYDRVERISPEYAEIVKYCLVIEPKNRITAEELTKVLSGHDVVIRNKGVLDKELKFNPIKKPEDAAEITGQEFIKQSEHFFNRAGKVRVGDEPPVYHEKLRDVMEGTDEGKQTEAKRKLREKQREEIKAIEEGLEKNIFYFQWNESEKKFEKKLRRDVVDDKGNFKNDIAVLRFNKESGHMELHIKGIKVNGKKTLEELKREGIDFGELNNLKKYIEDQLKLEDEIDTSSAKENNLANGGRRKIKNTATDSDKKPLVSLLNGIFLKEEIEKVELGSKEANLLGNGSNLMDSMVSLMPMEIASIEDGDGKREDDGGSEIEEFERQRDKISDEIIENVATFESLQEENAGNTEILFGDITASSAKAALIGSGLCMKEAIKDRAPTTDASISDDSSKLTIKVNGKEVGAFEANDDGSTGVINEENELVRKAAQAMAMDYNSNIFKIDQKIKDTEVLKAKSSNVEETNKYDELIEALKRKKEYYKKHKLANFLRCVLQLNTKKERRREFITEFAKHIREAFDDTIDEINVYDRAVGNIKKNSGAGYPDPKDLNTEDSIMVNYIQENNESIAKGAKFAQTLAEIIAESEREMEKEVVIPARS